MIIIIIPLPQGLESIVLEELKLSVDQLYHVISVSNDDDDRLVSILVVSYYVCPPKPTVHGQSFAGLKFCGIHSIWIVGGNTFAVTFIGKPFALL